MEVDGTTQRVAYGRVDVNASRTIWSV